MNVFLLQDASIIGGVENTTKNIVSMMNEGEKKTKYTAYLIKIKSRATMKLYIYLKQKGFII
ncbi:TPA: hypothetical protein ACNE00_004505 [Escherichia coli]|uniref:hypothetical protein n=1 Tax=Providencia stuartii TaxID=588 RepID=UPI000EF87C8D|nr:hypothetical protein [Providencia stuartii]RMA03819.1 hypothetical protein EA147_20190 [Providencia stuartii]